MVDRQILTADQMRGAEQAIFDAGTSVSDLMETAAGGAAEWIRRIAAGRSVTVLCGPGNNGGDGYVIARHLAEAGNDVTVVAPVEPKTDAARTARDRFGGQVRSSGREVEAEVLVDCLFGTGLARPLSGELVLLLRDLAARHPVRIAVDLPSGISSDSGELLNENLPEYDATLALGAWKFAHWSLPGRAKMGRKRLVPIGIDPVESAAQLITRPRIEPPERDSHKYRRGLCAVVAGSMPGASLLATLAAQRAGAGYVKLLSETEPAAAPPDLVIDTRPLAQALGDERIDALLCGPGLGREDRATERLAAVLDAAKPTVLDADALVLLRPGMVAERGDLVATPHDGELATLCDSFAVRADGRRDRARALARASAMVVVAKGPDTVVAAPDGRLAIAVPSPSWLSVAGTGDVLAGILASRLATGGDAFGAACEAVWLHGEAARLCGPAFTAAELARAVSRSLAAALVPGMP
ncbi:ribokinase-like superfamily protein [Erythrobacter litoralis]|uniref:Bifunctional NAD(P)H-hydrate repair enzyme n=1 Tax=Erythrobacter litoralis TaxID=39960 RepID=A0A074MG79_9SPHN|nr:bifunctional ADP-dependent NAD(P)H-hydrate dehydratase/NAD(P)H-hydrate epimerase [Erythrobacter litoralis]AOL23386.1 ribokinase-like superfamily protein [Erythrobacter litoralis]KEO92469.1 sugar kinase [Erythrobacter litoralis]